MNANMGLLQMLAGHPRIQMLVLSRIVCSTPLDGPLRLVHSGSPPSIPSIRTPGSHIELNFAFSVERDVFPKMNVSAGLSFHFWNS